jgi:hypothetical protein
MKSIRWILWVIFLILLAELLFQIYQYANQQRQNIFIFYQAIQSESAEKTANPNESFNDMEKQATWLVVGALISGIIGFGFAWVSDILRIRRERVLAADNRRRNFLASMSQIRHEASFVDYGNMGEIYKSLLPRISYQCGLIRDDFAHVSDGFDECLIALYRLDEPKINEPQNQAQIMKTIDLLIGFVERNHKKEQ